MTDLALFSVLQQKDQDWLTQVAELEGLYRIHEAIQDKSRARNEEVRLHKAQLPAIDSELQDYQLTGHVLENEISKLEALLTEVKDKLSAVQAQESATERGKLDLLTKIQLLEQEDPEEVTDIAARIALSRLRAKKLCGEVDQLKKRLDLDTNEGNAGSASGSMRPTRYSAPPATVPLPASPARSWMPLPASKSVCRASSPMTASPAQPPMPPTVATTESPCKSLTTPADIPSRPSPEAADPARPSALPQMSCNAFSETSAADIQHDQLKEEHDQQYDGGETEDMIECDSGAENSSTRDSRRTATPPKACFRCAKHGYWCGKPVFGPDVACMQCHRDSKPCSFYSMRRSARNSRKRLSAAEKEQLRHYVLVQKLSFQQIYETRVFGDITVDGLQRRWSTLKKRYALDVAKAGARLVGESSVTA